MPLTTVWRILRHYGDTERHSLNRFTQLMFVGALNSNQITVKSDNLSHSVDFPRARHISVKGPQRVSTSR